MTWKIESRQKSVAGLGGHNYLALIGPDGTVVNQIHGHNLDGRLAFRRRLAQPEVNGAAREIMSGTLADLQPVWDQLEANARFLGGDPERGDHSAKVAYGILSPNSNSFWATVLRMSGFDHRRYEPASDLWTPATGVDISDPSWWSPDRRWPGAVLPSDRGDTGGLRPHRLP